MTQRVTVDTNVFISATFWQGVPKQVIRQFETGQHILVISDEILTELERKLHHDKFALKLAEIRLSVAEIVDGIRRLAQHRVLPADIPDDAIRDPKDRIILGCAVGGQADVIVSGDRDLTDLGEYAGIPILTPAQFLDLIHPPQAPGGVLGR